MPWESHWVPPPTDLSLPVLVELPEGVGEWDLQWSYRSARGGGRWFYHCQYCKGWVEGHPTEFSVNTLGPLSGRMSTEYHCRRCGEEIAFSGMMS